jgi:hypothetical protein
MKECERNRRERKKCEEKACARKGCDRNRIGKKSVWKGRKIWKKFIRDAEKLTY